MQIVSAGLACVGLFFSAGSACVGIFFRADSACVDIFSAGSACVKKQNGEYLPWSSKKKKIFSSPQVTYPYRIYWCKKNGSKISHLGTFKHLHLLNFQLILPPQICQKKEKLSFLRLPWAEIFIWPVLRIRIRIRIHRIHVFFGLPDRNPLVRGVDPDPDLDPDPSIIHHAKIIRKILNLTILWFFLTFYLWKIM